MTLLDLFKNKIFQFPHAGSSNLPDFIQSTLKHYIDALTKVDDQYKDKVIQILNDVAKTSDSVNEIIRLTYSGNLIQSYKVLNNVLSRLEISLLEDRFPGLDEEYFYRARVENRPIKSINDMFHRPFEQRYDIHTSRFSIPGLPCLYLSNSVFTCWSELDMPSMDRMLVSRFTPTVKMRFLDLMPNYDWYVSVLGDIKSGENSDEWVRAMTFTMDVWLNRTLKIYPILLVCYSQVYSKSAVFKPEYIFPQLLMQWLITQSEYDGIKYMSNKCIPAGDWRNEFVNYAIPVKRVKPTGYCRALIEKFTLTMPLSLEILKLTNPLNISDVINIEALCKIVTTSKIEKFNISGSEYDYDTSAFKLLEKSIAKQVYRKLE